MDEAVIAPPPNNATPPSPRVRRHHGIMFWSAVGILTIGYGLFNFWVWRYTKSGKAPSPTKIWQTVKERGAGFGGFQGESRGRIPTPTPRLSSGTPTPTPRPTGPGEYACSAEDDCNLYSDEMRKGCPVTFADSQCLNSCGDPAKRCPK